MDTHNLRMTMAMGPSAAQRELEQAREAEAGSAVELESPRDPSAVLQARGMWVADDMVSACKECGQAFGARRRKHHCRQCGQIFCDECSAFKARLNADGEPDAYGVAWRVCVSCFRGGGLVYAPPASEDELETTQRLGATQDLMSEYNRALGNRDTKRKHQKAKLLELSKLRQKVRGLRPADVTNESKNKEYRVAPVFITDASSCKRCGASVGGLMGGARHTCRLCGQGFCEQCSAKTEVDVECTDPDRPGEPPRARNVPAEQMSFRRGQNQQAFVAQSRSCGSWRSRRTGRSGSAPSRRSCPRTPTPPRNGPATTCSGWSPTAAGSGCSRRRRARGATRSARCASSRPWRRRSTRPSRRWRPRRTARSPISPACRPSSPPTVSRSKSSVIRHEHFQNLGSIRWSGDAKEC